VYVVFSDLLNRFSSPYDLHKGPGTPNVDLLDAAGNELVQEPAKNTKNKQRPQKSKTVRGVDPRNVLAQDFAVLEQRLERERGILDLSTVRWVVAPRGLGAWCGGGVSVDSSPTCPPQRGTNVPSKSESIHARKRCSSCGSSFLAFFSARSRLSPPRINAGLDIAHATRKLKTLTARSP